MPTSSGLEELQCSSEYAIMLARTNQLTAEITYLTGDATHTEVDGPKLIAHICNDNGGWAKDFCSPFKRGGSNLKSNIALGTKGESPTTFRLVQWPLFVWVSVPLGWRIFACLLLTLLAREVIQLVDEKDFEIASWVTSI